MAKMRTRILCTTLLAASGFAREIRNLGQILNDPEANYFNDAQKRSYFNDASYRLKRSFGFNPAAAFARSQLANNKRSFGFNPAAAFARAQLAAQKRSDQNHNVNFLSKRSGQRLMYRSAPRLAYRSGPARMLYKKSHAGPMREPTMMKHKRHGGPQREPSRLMYRSGVHQTPMIEPFMFKRSPETPFHSHYSTGEEEFEDEAMAPYMSPGGLVAAKRSPQTFGASQGGYSEPWTLGALNWGALPSFSAKTAFNLPKRSLSADETAPSDSQDERNLAKRHVSSKLHAHQQPGQDDNVIIAEASDDTKKHLSDYKRLIKSLLDKIEKNKKDSSPLL